MFNRELTMTLIVIKGRKSFGHSVQAAIDTDMFDCLFLITCVFLTLKNERVSNWAWCRKHNMEE